MGRETKLRAGKSMPGLAAALAVLAALLLLAGCSPYQEYYRQRQHAAAKGKGPVRIAVVASSNLPNLTSQGAELAAELVNRRGGVLGGRRLELIQLDDEGSLQRGEKLARRLARDTGVVAVIGHTYSEVAIPCSIIYGTTGLLFMSTGASDPELTLIPNPFAFRNVPRDDLVAREIANLARKLGYKRMAVLFERSLYSVFYGLSLSQAFAAAAMDAGLEVAHVRSYFPWQEDARHIIMQLRQNPFDAMLLVGYLPQAARIIRQTRGLGIKGGIIGPDSLDNATLLTEAQESAEGVVVTSFFRPDLDRPQTRDFVAAFRAAYGQAPDDNAATAFDAINLLVAAMAKCGSSVPLEMAQALIYLDPMPGAASDYAFNEDGDVVDRLLWFKKVKGGQFHFLPDEYQPRSRASLGR